MKLKFTEFNSVTECGSDSKRETLASPESGGVVNGCESSQMLVAKSWEAGLSTT